jgi:aldehyde:ferredoxin oxidoreductase
MALNREAVDKLKEIFRAETGEELSDEEAWEIATRLFSLGHLLAEEESRRYSQPDFDAERNVINNMSEGCEGRSMSQAH